MKIANRICSVFLIIMMLFLTGCWNYREIESLSIVSGMAIDKGTSGYKYHATFQYIKLEGGAKTAAKPALLETDGDTIFDTVRNAVAQIEDKLFFSDCKIIIISKELAEEGITPLLDFLTRDAEARITVELIISDEGKAGDLLQTEPDSDVISAYAINKIIENSIKYLGKSPDVELYKATGLINGKGISLVLPLMAMRESGATEIPEVIGASIFKKDKLIGSLDDMESRYLLYIKNELEGGLLLTNVNSKEVNVSLEINKNETKCIPAITNGEASIQLDIKTIVNFAEENSFETNLNDLGIEEVQKCAAETVEAGIIKLIKKVQSEYGSDIFGFGNCIYKKYPDYWEENESQWNLIFSKLEVTVSVEVEITNTAVAHPRKNE